MSKKAQLTLYLRGVDYTALAEKIERGDYQVTSKYVPQPLKLETKIMEQEVIVGKTEKDPIYEKTDKNGRKKVYTTNIDLFAGALKRLTISHASSGATSDASSTNADGSHKPLRCVYCRRPFSMENQDNYLLSIIVEVEREGDKTYFHGYDPACTERCAYTQLDLERRLHPNNISYTQAERNFNYFLFLTTGATAPPALLPNWRLLESNDGSMSATEFFGSPHTYKRLDRVIILPVKLQYE